jgi:hypothetical protein
VTQQPPAAGWYPDPSDPAKKIYWDGAAWGGPPAPTGAASNISKEKAVAFGVCVLAAIGLFMSMQSVSLLTGTGSLWTGVAIAAVGTAAAFFLGAAKWVRVVASLCLAFALFNVIYMESQLSQKREELSHVFDN